MKINIDVGSTIVKTSLIVNEKIAPFNTFYDRDYERDISAQVKEIIAEKKSTYEIEKINICSSANGGIKVGIISRSIKFSESIAKNLCSSAGANIIFCDLLSPSQLNKKQQVDILIIAGGVNGYNLPLLEESLLRLDLSRYSFDSLLYCGNNKYFGIISLKFPAAIQVKNPMGEDLKIKDDQLLSKVRSAYLDNLIDKKGIRELINLSTVPVWPTPAIVNLAYRDILNNRGGHCYAFPLIVIDIGGATTDIHFGSELCDEAAQVNPFNSTNRHVFTDIGVFTSRESTFNRLRYNSLLPDFLSTISENQATDKLMEILDGVRDDSILFAACFFLAFYRLAHGNQEDGTPKLSLQKAGAVLITGGASQCLDERLACNLLSLLLPKKYQNNISVHLDNDYRLWSHGLNLLQQNFINSSEKL